MGARGGNARVGACAVRGRFLRLSTALGHAVIGCQSSRRCLTGVTTLAMQNIAVSSTVSLPFRLMMAFRRNLTVSSSLPREDERTSCTPRRCRQPDCLVSPKP